LSCYVASIAPNLIFIYLLYIYVSICDPYHQHVDSSSMVLVGSNLSFMICWVARLCINIVVLNLQTYPGKLATGPVTYEHDNYDFVRKLVNHSPKSSEFVIYI
jgi:hypothetical protein